MIPNPFAKDATLSSLAKRVELIEESLGLPAIIIKIVALLIVGFFLSFIFPWAPVVILIGIQILVQVVFGFIKVSNIKRVSKISTERSAQAYRSVLLTSEYYDFLEKMIWYSVTIASLLYAYFFFSGQLPPTTADQFTPQQLNILFWALIGYLFFLFALSFIRYRWVSEIPVSDDLARVDKAYLVVDKKIKLIAPLPWFAIVFFIFYLAGAPVFMIAIMAALVLFIGGGLGIAELRRIQNVSFEENGIDRSIVRREVMAETGEQVVGAVFGITRAMSSWKDLFRPTSVSVLGSGKSYNPENTLLITNRRFLFVQVPMPGGNKVIDGTDYALQNVFLNRGELRKRGEEMMQSQSLSQILELVTKGVSFEEVKTVTFKRRSRHFTIEKNDGELFGYIFFDKEYSELLAQWLTQYLPQKLVLK